MSRSEQITLPVVEFQKEQEPVITSDCVIKYVESGDGFESLVVASIFDGDDPIKEVQRVESIALKQKSFISKKERDTVEFCTFRPSHHIATALLGHKKDDTVPIQVGDSIFNCIILDFLIPEVS